MKHRASPRFWERYNRLPQEIQRQADRCYDLLVRDSRHPSLHFKKVGDLWSVRIGIHYRALALEEGSDFVWIWIGHHAEYDQLLKH